MAYAFALLEVQAGLLSSKRSCGDSNFVYSKTEALRHASELSCVFQTQLSSLLNGATGVTPPDIMRIRRITQPPHRNIRNKELFFKPPISGVDCCTAKHNRVNLEFKFDQLHIDYTSGSGAWEEWW